MTSGSTQAAVEAGPRQAHGWGVPPLCTQLRMSPQPSHGGGGAPLLPVPVWAPQASPPPNLFPPTSQDAACAAGTEEGLLATPDVLEGHMEKYKKPLVLEAAHTAGWPVTRAGGLSLRKLRCWLDPRLGGRGDTGLGENNTSVCRVLPPGEACQPPGVGWGGAHLHTHFSDEKTEARVHG